MTLRKILRLSAALLAATSLSGCLDVAQKIAVDKGELSYTAELRIDAKLAALANKKDGFCAGFDEASGESMKVQVSESAVDGNVVCKLTAKGPIEKFATFTAGNKETALVNVSRASEGAWRIDSSFDMKDKGGANPMMEGMMQAMLAGRTLSWSVTVPKVLETNGQVASDGKTVTWSVPLASAYKEKQSFHVVFNAERPWYSFLLDLIDAIKKFFGSLFGGGDKAPAPAAAPAAAPVAAPAPASAPVAEPAPAAATASATEPAASAAAPAEPSR